MDDPLIQAHNEATEIYYRSHAYALLKQAGDSEISYSLSGRLYLSKSGWLLLSVPNSLARGAFDAINESGVELPYQPDGVLNAHITVASPEEIESIGGASKIDERGHQFAYTLGPVRSCVPDGWPEYSKVYYIEVQSPALKALRKSYGLSPLPKEDHEFHITFGRRRKGVLLSNQVTKMSPTKDHSLAANKLWEYVDKNWKKNEIKAAGV